MARAKIPSPLTFLRHFLDDPRAITAGFLAVSACGLGIALWLILRNLRHNEPGLKTPTCFVLAILIAGSGLAGAHRLPEGRFMPVAAMVCMVAGSLFYFADWKRYVRAPDGRIVFDRWKIVLRYARFSWTRDKINRHFFVSGETGAGKTTGLNQLLTQLIRRDPHLG